MARCESPEALSMPRTKEHADDITAWNQTASPLLRLPRELRDMIYELALTVKSINVVCIFTPCTSTPSTSASSTPCGKKYTKAIHSFASVPGEPSQANSLSRLRSLTTTCRQIHAETKLLPYALNDFHLHPELLTELVNVLPDNVKQEVKVLRFRFQSVMLRLSSSDFWKEAKFESMKKLSRLEKIILMTGLDKLPSSELCLVKEELNEYISQDVEVVAEQGW
ncbi:Nn.00g030680.m01.CDS01 [Neocucurbitaria sp. VM-36]